jgi:PAS domain S-box-containing protein
MRIDPSTRGIISWFKQKSTDSMFLVGLAVVLSILICGLVSYIYYQQKLIIAQTTEQLEDFRQARVDLARGYLYSVLSTTPGSPYDIHQGQALLEQAVNSMEHAAKIIHGQSYYLTPEDQARIPVVTGFRETMRDFRFSLAEWSEYSENDSRQLVKLRIAYFNLDRQADQMDRSIRLSIADTSARMAFIFYITLILSAAFLVGVCLIIFTAGRMRDRADRDLKVNEARLRALLNHIPDLVWMKDDSGHYISGNAPFIQGMDMSEAQIMGKTDLDLWPPAKAKKFVNEDRQVETSGDVLRVIETLKNKSGEEIWFETVKAPIRQANGKITGTVGISRNIHDRKMQEDQIRRLNDELEQRVSDRTFQLETINQELEAFNYSVSHDLRAPLRGIDGLTRLIQQENSDHLTPEGLKMLDNILAEIMHMERLIDSLLSLARISRSEINLTRVDLSNISVSVSRSIQEAYPDICMEWHIEPNVYVNGDERLLEIVMNNLIGNAFKFSCASDQPRIEIGTITDKHTRAIYVRDNGIGFDSDHAPKLFSAFQRMDNSQGFPGYGIGLAIVKRIILRHGGRIWANSRPGQGAAFYFTLNNGILSEPAA